MATNDNFDPLIKSINDGKVSRVAVEFIEGELIKLSEQVDSAIFIKMNSGDKLSYEELAMAFAQKHAYKNLLKSMRQTSRKGESAGTKFKKITEEKEDGRNAKRTFSTYRGTG